MTAKGIGEVVHRHIQESLAKSADEIAKYEDLERFAARMSADFAKLFDTDITDLTLKQIDDERIKITYHYSIGTQFGSLLRDVKASIWSRRCIRTRRRLRGSNARKQ